MDIKSRIRKIIPIALLFVAAFFAGHFMAKGTAKETSAQLDSANDSWGLSFPEKGKTPVVNANIDELKQYNAYFAENT